MTDVATKKVYENEKIAVWEMLLEPGENTGVHTHKREYMFFAIEGAPLEVIDKDGNSLGVIDIGTDSVTYLKIVGDDLVSEFGSFPVTHDAKNVGKSRYREVLVEFK